jgi:hypothetical protein
MRLWSAANRPGETILDGRTLIGRFGDEILQGGHLAALLRTWLRRRPWWIELQAINREGWRAAWRRYRIQRAILSTPPVFTLENGEEEVRVLTWKRDWINLIWTLKSFYRFSGAHFPLYIHDGGLAAEDKHALLAHFPNAILISRADADSKVETILQARGLSRCLLYRRRNPTTLKLFDFFLLSSARTIISMDSDIIFFRRPSELIDGACPPNRYNRDESYFYTLGLEELQRRFGFFPVSHINSGLSRLSRGSIDFDAVEKCLQDQDLFADQWVTEQTLHALCSNPHPPELLPGHYLVSTKPGLTDDLVCKHYPGTGRYLLYEEGMRYLIDAGFCRELRSAVSLP